jgi:hypothetical protein
MSSTPPTLPSQASKAAMEHSQKQLAATLERVARLVNVAIRGAWQIFPYPYLYPNLTQWPMHSPSPIIPNTNLLRSLPSRRNGTLRHAPLVPGSGPSGICSPGNGSFCQVKLAVSHPDYVFQLQNSFERHGIFPLNRITHDYLKQCPLTLVRSLMYAVKDMPQGLPAKIRRGAQDTMEILLHHSTKHATKRDLVPPPPQQHSQRKSKLLYVLDALKCDVVNHCGSLAPCWIVSWSDRSNF